MIYRAYGHLVESDREIPELPLVSNVGPAGISVRWVTGVEIPNGLRWSTVWTTSGGEPDVVFARTDTSRYLRIGDRAAIRITGDVAIEIAGGCADPAWLRHVLLDQILPLALASSGETVLHASAVAIDGGAVLLVGEAGTGKSTLASALGQRGFPVLADDGILLKDEAEWALAVPSYPGLRLWPDAVAVAGHHAFALTAMSAYSSKQRLIPAGSGAEFTPLSVSAVLSLLPDAGPLRVERLSRRDAALQFVQHAFIAEPDVAEALTRHLERACRWSRLIDVWSVRYVRDLSSLPALAMAVAAHVRDTPSGRLLAR